MRFKYYDHLRAFCVVAECKSFAEAAEELNLTKGAVSYQIGKLEDALGFAVFERFPRGVKLSIKGNELWRSARAAFGSTEAKIGELQREGTKALTIGLSTYFASRWLSPKLMLFMNSQPEIRIRLQPMLNLIDLHGEDVDVVIRWGNGRWTDMVIKKLFSCPAFPAASPEKARWIDDYGLEKILAQGTLLKDSESSRAWEDWYQIAGLTYQNKSDILIVPDPNVRVQTVLNSQGIALFDSLIKQELEQGTLIKMSEHELDEYGYFLAYKPDALEDKNVKAFVDWISSCAK